MLKNLDETDNVQDIKQKWFMIECVLNRSTFNFSPLIRLLFSFLLFLPIVSIFFAVDIFEPLEVNKVFRYLHFSQFQENFSVSQIVIDAIVLIICLFIIILTIVLLKSGQIGSVLAKTYIVSMTLFIILAVPINQLMVSKVYQSIKKSETTALDTIQLVFTIALSILVFFVTLLALLYTKFNFNPLRKNNQVWKLQNNDSVYFFLINLSRVYVIALDGISVAFSIISIVCQIFRRIHCQGSISKLNQLIENNFSNFVLVTNFSVLVSLAFNQPILGFQIWIFLLLLFTAYTLILFSAQYLKKFYIPECSIKPTEHYDFFFNIKQKIASNSELAYIQKSFNEFINIHFLNCKQEQCNVKEWIAKEQKSKSLNELEYLVTTILHNKKNDDLFKQFLNELWACENGRKFQFKKYEGKSIDLQYIESYAQNTIKLIENNSQIIQSNSLMINKIFYNQIFTTAQNFSDFYEQVSKTHPRVETILSTGYQIQRRVGKIKSLFSQMIRNRTLNFKSVQLYMDFLTYFFNEDVIDNDMIQRLKKIQKANDVEDVNQSYLPCLTVVLDTGIIENSNMEILKFLQMNKYQMKGKYLVSLILPQITFPQLMEVFKSSNQEEFLVFVKKSNNNTICMKLQFSIKQIKSNKIGFVTMQKDPFSDKKSVVMVNSSFEIQSITAEKLTFKFNRSTGMELIDINCRQVFQENIYPIRDQLLKLQMLKISSIKGKPFLSIQVNLTKTYNANYWIVCIKFMKNYAQRSSLPYSGNQTKNAQKPLANNNYFSFRYDQHGNKALLRGQAIKNDSKNQVKKNKNQGFGTIQRELQKLLVNRTVIKRSSYAQGIKVYRLFDEDLYNIDLQDKQAYNALFDEHQTAATAIVKQGHIVSDYCLIFIIFLLSLILIVMSSVLIFEVRGATTSIATDFNAGQNIQIFRIDFNRIMAVFRDVASEMYYTFNKPWIPDIQESYNRIQNRQITPLFTDVSHTVKYGFETFEVYQGNLNQLSEVILSHTFQVVKKLDSSIIEAIHETVIRQIGPMVNQQKITRFDNIEGQIDYTINFKLNFIIVLIIGTVFYYFLMIMLCTRLVSSIKEKLSKLMVMSDSESRWYQDNAEKVKHLIQVIDKNYDVDMENYFSQKQEFNKRKKPKQPILGERLLQLIGIIVIIFFVANVLCLVLYNSTIDNELSTFKILTDQGLAFTEIYSQMCHVTNTIQHTGQIRQNQVKQIMEKLDLVEKYRSNFLFSTEFNDQLQTFFFKSSCNLLVQLNITTSFDCKDATPKFLIQDPFNLGLSIYFRRAHYSIINNITETFASTGIHSKIFASLFIIIAENVKRDGGLRIDSIIQMLTIFNFALILINIVYTIVAILVSFYLKKQVSKAKRLIIFLNLNDAKSKQQREEQQRKQKTRKNTLLSKQRKSKVSLDESAVKNNAGSLEDIIEQNNNSISDNGSASSDSVLDI